MADDNEMVKVHVDDGTKYGHDRKFLRKDAEKFIGYTPGASIMESEATAEEEAPAESKMMAPAEDKAQRAPRRSMKKDEEAPAEEESNAEEAPAESK